MPGVKNNLLSLLKEVDVLKAEYTAEKNYDFSTYSKFTKSTSTYNKAVEIAKKLSQSPTAIYNYANRSVVIYIKQVRREFEALKLMKIDKTPLANVISIAEEYYNNENYQQSYRDALFAEVGDAENPKQARKILQNPLTQVRVDNEVVKVNRLIEDVKNHSIGEGENNTYSAS